MLYYASRGKESKGTGPYRKKKENRTNIRRGKGGGKEVKGKCQLNARGDNRYCYSKKKKVENLKKKKHVGGTLKYCVDRSENGKTKEVREL